MAGGRDTVSMMSARLLAAFASAALAACAHLLPAASVDARADFGSFADARQALEKIEPYKTRFGELAGLGFDVAAPRNVTLLNYPDLARRLAPEAVVALDALDPGIRDCILARARCVVYGFRFKHEQRERTGGFLGDFFNFERTSRVTGWTFDAVIAVRDDTVVFRGFNGEPENVRVEHQRNPLGPLQSIGDSVFGDLVH
jgi:hypothetical protein